LKTDEWLSSREISQRLKIHKHTVSEVAFRHGLEIKSLSKRDKLYKLSDIVSALSVAQANPYNKRFIEAPLTRIYDDYWKLPWDEFICACDTHSPHLNEKLFHKMLDVAERYKIKNFMHAGDFFDQNTFSRFDSEPDDMVDWDYEIDYSRKILQSLKSVFENVYFFMGSHDVRFWLMLLRTGKFSKFDTPFRLCGVDGIETSKYRYAEIGKEWRINHPKNVVKVGGLPALRMIAKHNRSIVFGHGHWWGMEKDPSGKHYLIAPGCMVDGRRIAYKSIWDTSHNEWVGGFLLVVDKDKPILFNDDSPWEIYLNAKPK